LALCAVLALTAGSTAAAQGKGKEAEDPKWTEKDQAAFDDLVNKAIDRGVAHLREIGKKGVWQYGNEEHSVGATGLAGLALLESGVKETDDAVQTAARVVRNGAVTLTLNYAIATSILFLDRLGDPQDVPIIQSLGIRLLAAYQTSSKGWSYETSTPPQTEIARLKAVLAGRKEPGTFIPLKERKPLKPADLPADIRKLYTDTQPHRMRPGQSIDNSNTQFALIGLWVARRHGIPVDAYLIDTDKRLRETQYYGGWAYKSPYLGRPLQPKEIAMLQMMPDMKPSLQMTCCGMIGLGLGYGAEGKGIVKRDLAKDAHLQTGFSILAGFIGNPTGDVTQAARLGENSGRSYYALWVLERTAVMFDLKKIGGKDWYRWGAEILLANQGSDGSWRGMFADGGVDTCFALLFLKRANLTADLSTKIKGKEKELTKTIAPPQLLEGFVDPFGGATKRPRGSSRAPLREPGAVPVPGAPAPARPQLSLVRDPAPREAPRVSIHIDPALSAARPRTALPAWAAL
jgi:hypothetical protein